MSELARAASDALLDHRYIVRVFSGPDKPGVAWENPGAAIVDHTGRVSVYRIEAGGGEPAGRVARQMLEEYQHGSLERVLHGVTGDRGRSPEV